MSRTRFIITLLVFLATFAWLLTPDLKHSPAVLWPSIVAVGLAFLTRDIYVSLFLGALSGAVLLRGGNIAAAFLDLFTRHLIPALKDPWNISVLIFTLLMGGFVELINRNGGMAALAEGFLGRGHSRRRAALGAYILGWILFFDGLASSMLVGKAMRPVTDRAGLSREKLSFIVDSTSSPIAGLALISTWVAYEISVIRQGFENIGDAQLAAQVAPYQLLVQSLPYRFYNYFILLLVFWTIWLARDFGPMLAAERKARPVAESVAFAPPRSFRFGRVALALIPLLVLVVGVFGGLFVDGGGWQRPFSIASVVEAFGKADAATVFVCATAVAVVVALILSAMFPVTATEPTAVTIFFEGMKQMFLPTLILVFAWTLNAVIKEIGAAPYLVSFLGDKLSPTLLPVLVFVLASLVSFSTGTSWGTMAILMPLVIPVAAKLTGLHTAADASSPQMIATIGAVLTGAVFGDHCSPISDTTIVSAFSSDCDLMAHVNTQMPYALVAAVLAVFLGYGPAGWKISPYLLLLVGGLACWMLVRFGGARTRE